VVEARGQRRLVAEVARQADDPQAPVLGRELGEDRRSRVARSVVDDDELERELRPLPVAVDDRRDLGVAERAQPVADLELLRREPR